MAQPCAKQIARLASVACALQEKRVFLADLQQQLETVERAGIIAVGEAEAVATLNGRLDEALSMLHALAEAEVTQQATAQLTELEALPEEPEWEPAGEIPGELTAKVQDHRDQIEECARQVADWQSQIGTVQAAIGTAARVRAPIARQESTVRRLDAIVRQTDQALRNLRRGWEPFKSFLNLTELVAQLEDSQDELQQLSKQIEDRIKRTGNHALQADLLLLQSPLIDDRYYEYTVLLRTPSEPGSHGINIQASSHLARQDRKRIIKAFGDITDAINKGLARQFELHSQRASEPDTQPVPPAGENGDAVEAAEPEGELRDLLPPDANNGEAVFQPVNDLALKIGGQMYDLFMPESMQRYLDTTDCSITITTNDLELPWELMHTGQEFLCLERPVARMPMGFAFPRVTAQLLPKPGKRRFLLIYADPGEPPSLAAAGKEVQRIKEDLEKAWPDDAEIEVLWREQADGSKLNEALLAPDYDVIHYAGHADFDADDPELSGLLLHDREIFFAEKVHRMLKGRPLVFLNACKSGRTANEEEPQKINEYLQKPAGGLASYFIYGGARACIGALWPIYDGPAAEFAVDFYNKVLEGHMIGEAMWLARQEIRTKYPNQITWASFVLYGDPTARLD